MRRTVDLLIGFCALMLSVMASVGCTTDPENPVNDPLAPSVEIDEMTRISVLLKGQVGVLVSEENASYGFDLAEGGFASGKVVTYNADNLLYNHFSTNASLTPGKYYSVKSWYSSGKKKKYSQEVVFMAPDNSAATLSDITYSDGVIRATILDTGGSDISAINEVGFCWSTVNTKSAIKQGEKGQATLEGNDFYMSLSGLMPEKTYFFLAYADNSETERRGYNSNPFELALSFDNYVDIEDDGFESNLLAHYDLDHSGWLSTEELALVDKIDVSTDSIHSIREINLMPALNTLIAKGSEKGKGKLTTVDVTNNTGLRTLICDNNNLESLLIQQADGVNSTLEVLSVNNTGLASFDVSPFVALRQFACSDNHVEAIDFTPLKILDSLVCSYNDIRKLDISGNPLLRYLDVTSNPLDTIFLSATQKVPSLLKPETAVLYYLIDGITVTPDTLRIFVGETKQVSASVIPAEAVDKTVNWSSNDEGIASVSSYGEVTGIDVGSCTVTATSWGHTAQCHVIVMPIDVESVSLDCDTKDMVPGERFVLHANVLPENATDKTVTWDTTDSGVATVSSSGEVTAVGPGSCIISATSGTKTATCKVIVTVPVSSITLDQTTKELNVGDSFTLQATVLPDNATDKTVIWTTSDPKVAAVSSSGIVTAMGPGACTITANCGGKSVSCSVSVVVPVASVTLDQVTKELNVGETFTLKATVLPDNSTEKVVVWNTSNSSVASVTLFGVVTALKAGSCTITASCGGKTASCEVTVTIPVSSIELDQTSKALSVGESFVLKATVLPENATDKTVTWETSDAGVASVTSSGKVTAIGPGSCIISATSGTKTATCQVTVADTVPVSSITLDQKSKEINVGESFTLNATVLPENATDKTVTWDTSDSGVATVSSSGEVSAIGPGICSISAMCGKKIATCLVTVTIPVSSITLDQTSKELNVGETFVLNATVLPENATDKTVTWGTSDTGVATVSSSGKVTAVGAGSCTISATSGTKTATCRVTVTVPVSSITLDQTSKTLSVGESFVLNATVLPTNATDKTVTWGTSDTGVATVSSSGKVSAVGAGSCTISATSGTNTATCRVTVTVPVSSITLDQTSKTINVGESFVLNATVLPTNATDKTITWNTSDAGVATVSSSGKVTAVGAGSCTISATSGTKTATCQVTVTVPVSSITLDQTSKELYIGEPFSLNATVFPSDAADKTIVWTTSDATVATVSQTGAVRAVGKGSCAITASATSGVSASCTCNVVGNAPVFEDDVFRSYIYSNFDKNNDDFLSREEVLLVTDIYCRESAISSLSGIEYFPNVRLIRCDGNRLTSLDVSRNSALDFLTCANNQLTSLDVSSNPALKAFWCDHNQLTSLDVSSCPALELLICGNNQLTSLDVSSNPVLKLLDCESNQLTSLNVSNNPVLQYLHCYNNELTSLDVSSNPVLENLYCYNNQLTSLDVSNNPALQTLKCYGNPSLTEIWLKTGQTIENMNYDSSVSTIYYK